MDLSSGLPYWLIKNGLPFNYPKLDHDIDTDVVILGGGISGALAGYYLVKAGIECVVIDSRSIGLGSTSASTSLLQYEIDIPLSRLTKKIGADPAARAYRMGVESISTLEKISAELGFDEFEMKQSLYFAAAKRDISFLKKEYEARKSIGLKVNYLAQKDVESHFGFSTPGAILSEDAGQLNPYLFTHTLHQYNKSCGSRIFDRSPVTGILHHTKNVTLHTMTGHNVTAKKIVYATGYEVLEMLDRKIVDLQSTYVTIGEQPNKNIDYWQGNSLLWNTANPYLYLRTTKEGRILIGGRDEKFYNPSKRDSLLKSKGKRLARDFSKLFPDIPFSPEFTWTGTFGVTKDGLPYIGKHPRYPHGYFALGFGGNGITFSVIAAQIITDLIRGRRNNDVELFGFNRK